MDTKGAFSKVLRFVSVIVVASLGLASIIATEKTVSGPGGPCDSAADCTTGLVCSEPSGTCCWPLGAASDSAADCCTGQLNSEGFCCVGSNAACTDDVDCCDDLACRGGRCCIPEDGACSGDDNCCGDAFCFNGTCTPPAPQCAAGCYWNYALERCICDDIGPLDYDN